MLPPFAQPDLSPATPAAAPNFQPLSHKGPPSLPPSSPAQGLRNVLVLKLCFNTSHPYVRAGSFFRRPSGNATPKLQNEICAKKLWESSSNANCAWKESNHSSCSRRKLPNEVQNCKMCKMCKNASFFLPPFQMKLWRHKAISRFGLMHMIATNICVWFNVLILETFHEISNTR
jgi:hypothetical protein